VALAVFLVVRGLGPGPISYDQMMNSGAGENAALNGQWSAPDGVAITFSNPRPLGEGVGGAFSFENNPSGLLNWTSEVGRNGSGTWLLSDIDGGKQATIELHFGCYAASCSAGGNPIVLLVKGDAANPVFVCQSPTDGDPCLLRKASSLR
jgi:hypothetical protein